MGGLRGTRGRVMPAAATGAALDVFESMPLVMPAAATGGYGYGYGYGRRSGTCPSCRAVP